MAHVRAQVAPGDLAQGLDELEHPAIGAALEQYLVPLVLQIETARGVPTDSLEAAVDVAEPSQPLGGGAGREAQSQRFEDAQNDPGFAELHRIQRSDPKPATRARLDDSFADQAKQGLADGRAADAELGGELGIAKAEAGGEVTALDAGEDLAVDLIPECNSRYHMRGAAPCK